MRRSHERVGGPHPQDPPLLVGIEAGSRSTDPVTSFMAADNIERSGRADRRRKEVLHELMLVPGLTSAEVARNLRLDRHDPARRLPELEKAGLVRKGPRRQCSACRNSCVTWYAVRRDPNGQARFL